MGDNIGNMCVWGGGGGVLWNMCGGMWNNVGIILGYCGDAMKKVWV